MATLFGILANRGAGWGTTDEELEQLLIDESFAHPSDLPRAQDGRVPDDVLVETASPAHRVTLTAAGDVVVRSLGDRDRQPSVWQYDSVRPTGPGQMLTIADSEGVEHRLGVVTLISRIDSTATGSVTGSGTGSGRDTPAATSIDGLARDTIGNAVWLVLLEDGARLLITQRLHFWQVDRRAVTKTTHAWNQVVRCRVGENFVYETAGGEAVTLGEVVKLLLVES